MRLILPEKEGMSTKKVHKIILAALAVCLVVFHFAVPRKAVKGEYRIHSVDKGSFNITEQLTDEQIDRLETLLEGTTCTRWKNPIGSFRIAEDTVTIIGMDDDGLCIFTLVGADDRYDVRERTVKDGEALWKAVLEILP